MRLSQLRLRRHAFMTSGKHRRKAPAKTLYELLGVRPDADAKTLHLAFREAAKVYHPDLNPGDPDATRRFTQIVNAYGILRNAEQRGAYDGLLALERERRHARLMRTVSDSVAVVALSVVIVGGFALFAQMSKTSIEAAKVVDAAARKVADLAAVQSTAIADSRPAGVQAVEPEMAADTSRRDEPSGKSARAELAEAPTAPSAVAPEAESHAPLMAADDSPAPDPAGSKSEVAEAVDALLAAIDRGDMGRSAGNHLAASNSEVARAVDALTAAIDRGDMGRSASDHPIGSNSEVARAIEALVAAVDRGDMGSGAGTQRKNDGSNPLDRTRAGSAESPVSSPEKIEPPSAHVAIVDEKHDVRTNAKPRAQAKRPVTDRTTVGQAAADIRSASQLALASRNASPCAGSCSERAPPLFGVGF
jgi:curved DNA-binding protein CbpA